MEFEIKCLAMKEYNGWKVSVGGIFRHHKVNENGLFGINNIKLMNVKFSRQ